MSLSDLKRFIQIDDKIRTRVKKELLVKQKASANMVASKSDKKNFKKKKFNTKNQNLKNLNVQKKEFKKTGRYFNCDRQGRFAKACKHQRRKKRRRPIMSIRSTTLLLCSSR